MVCISITSWGTTRLLYLSPRVLQMEVRSLYGYGPRESGHDKAHWHVTLRSQLEGLIQVA